MRENPYTPPPDVGAARERFPLLRRVAAALVGLSFCVLFIPFGLQPWRAVSRLWEPPKPYVIPTPVLFPALIAVDLGLAGLFLIALALWKANWRLGRWGLFLLGIGVAGGSMPVWFS